MKAAQDVAYRRWHKLIEHAKPDAAGYMPDDGMHIWMAREDLTPGDDFLAGPPPPIATETEV